MQVSVVEQLVRLGLEEQWVLPWRKVSRDLPEVLVSVRRELSDRLNAAHRELENAEDNLKLWRAQGSVKAIRDFLWWLEEVERLTATKEEKNAR